MPRSGGRIGLLSELNVVNKFLLVRLSTAFFDAELYFLSQSVWLVTGPIFWTIHVLSAASAARLHCMRVNGEHTSFLVSQHSHILWNMNLF